MSASIGVRFLGRRKMEYLDFILADLAILEISPQTYTYQTEQGILISYYMLDIEKLLKQQEVQQIHFQTEDIQNLPISEPYLFEKVISNTEIILPARILSFTSYLREAKIVCKNKGEEVFLERLAGEIEKQEKDKKLWCLTNSICFLGAIGIFQVSVLKEFCIAHGFSKILLGLGNRDFVYITDFTKEEVVRMNDLLDKAPDILENNGTLIEKHMLLYISNENSIITIF